MAVSRILVSASMLWFGGTALATSTPSQTGFNASSIQWSKCPDQVPLSPTPVPDTVDCGRISVPLNHYKSSNETIELGMMRLKATGPDPEGILFFNSGGPGMASSIAIHQQALWENETNPGRNPKFSAELRASYNIIGLDQRGEGLSSPLACDKDLFNAKVPNIALDDTSFEALVKHNQAVVESCSRMTGPLFELMGTDQRIRDLELVRQASGAPKLNWIGWSGGTQIGIEYAELHPDKVSRMVLDGNNARSLSDVDNIIGETVAFEAALEYFFRWCNTTAECALNGQDAASIFDSLMDAAELEPLPAPGCIESKLCYSNVTSEDFIIATLSMLNSGHPVPRPTSPRSQSNFYGLSEALAEVHETGNATKMSLALVQLDTAISETSLPHMNILCSDYTRNHIRSAADLRSIFTPARALAPHTRGINVMQHARTMCLGWPFEPTDPPHLCQTA